MAVRYLYSLLFYLAVPLILLRLWWRSFRAPAYWRRLGERFGYCPFRLERSIWVHAVSVGETIAAIPLIQALKQQYPNHSFLVTTMTPTGAERVQAALGNGVSHTYIPYDLPTAVNRFLAAMNPCIGIIMETELWPNLIAACHRKHIPLALINARLSKKSAMAYHRIASLTREMLKNIDCLAAQGELDAKRFIALGAKAASVNVTGNIKFDLAVPLDLLSHAEQLRAALGRERFIWIAASTHDGEEEMILAAHQLLRKKIPDSLLILVPRHADRFEAVAKLSKQQGFMIAKRSQQETITQQTAIYLGDTMGELLLLYAVADVAFVGGSYVPKGGHNMLEPGALGKPILTGEHLFNFADIALLFISAQALIKVTDAAMLVRELIQLQQNKTACKEMGERARLVVNANRGALEKQFILLKNLLDEHLQ